MTTGVEGVQTESIPVDSPRWHLEGKATVTEYSGRPALSLDGGRAALRDFEVADGVIDVDIAGSGERGFYNIEFRNPSNTTRAVEAS